VIYFGLNNIISGANPDPGSSAIFTPVSGIPDSLLISVADPVVYPGSCFFYLSWI
jgi:hypothetical protein